LNNLTLDAANFSEQLGIYDFFNIIVSGTIFVFGLCSIWKKLMEILWADLTISTGLTLIVIIFLSGLVLQELSSLLDKHVMKVQSGARYNFLKDSIHKETEISFLTSLYRFIFSTSDANTEEEYTTKDSTAKPNSIIHNSLLLYHYRNLARSIIERDIKQIDGNLVSKIQDNEWSEIFNKDHVNSYIYSVCQYYVAASGKDKKVEKLRALFGMSRSLTLCFAALYLFSLTPYATGDSITLPISYEHYQVLLALLTVIFRLRMNKTIRYMTLILLGNYDALLRHSEISSTLNNSSQNSDSTVLPTVV